MQAFWLCVLNPPLWWAEVFDARYAELYADVTTTEATEEEVSFLSRVIGPTSRLLDVACGYGRHVIGLSQLGYDVVGIDRSTHLIELARAKASMIDGSRPRFVVADYRQIPFHQEFDAAICMFTSFGYFRRRRDNKRVLESVAHALKPGGTFLLDLNNPTRVRDFILRRDHSRLSSGRWARCSYCRRRADGTVVHTTEKLNSTTLRWCGHSSWQSPSGKVEFGTEVQLYSLAELTGMLVTSGLVPDRIWGGFDASEYDLESSRRLIVLARRPLPT